MKKEKKQLQLQLEQIDIEIQKMKTLIKDTLYDINDKKTEKYQIIQKIRMINSGKTTNKKNLNTTKP